MHAFLSSTDFFKITFFKLNSLDPDQAEHFGQPGLGPNCLQKLSVNDPSRQRVNLYHAGYGSAVAQW